MASLIPPVIAAAIASLAIFFLLRTRKLPADRPNERSLHRDAVPRGGGLAVWLGWFAATLWLPVPKPWLWPLIAVVVISLLDDRYGMPALLRLFVHVAAAIAWLKLAGFAFDAAGFALVVLAVVWMANLYNFMDGSDGLTGVMSIVGFTTLGLALVANGEAVMMFALAAALVPFLLWNWPPARLFLGDVGSVPLGFLTAVFAITGWQSAWWPLWFPLLVFLPFIADATLTLAMRLLRRERIWQAHREHIYQRLVQLGFGHGGTLALYAALIVGTSSSALAALTRAPSAGPALLLAWSAVFAALFGVVAYSWSTRNTRVDESKR